MLLEAGVPSEKKENFIGGHKHLRFKELSDEEKAAAIAKNPAYGRVICRCETITEGEILDSASVTKTVVSANYREGGSVVYAVSIQNNSEVAITDGTLVDNLGGYTTDMGTVYPLNYRDGSLLYYVDGVLTTAPTVTGIAPITVSGINIPAQSSALLIYEATVTEFAPIEAGSTITNEATVSLLPCATSVTATETVPVEETVNLTIAKAICPGTVTSCGEITYTFIIQNSGNSEVVATDDVLVTDTFNPILNPIAVTYNGEAWVEGTNYTYSTTTGEFATLPGQITVPAATYSTNPVTGAITTTPGVAVITVTGTV
jgi:hypothetical protein